MSSRPILVTGAHRSGTTWVGKMLAASTEVAYISEPLNVLHRPGVFRAKIRHWYTYICSDNESQYLAAYHKLLSLQYGLWAELCALRSGRDFARMGRDATIFWLGKLRRARPLMKDPFAVFSIPWFVERLGCDVVVTVRHPAAFASSLKRLGWSFDFNDLLQQPLLMRDRLEPFRAEMEAVAAAPADILTQAALLWRIIYSVAVNFPQPENLSLTSEASKSGGGVIVVRHEDLSRDPVDGYRRLYTSLGLRFMPKVERTILDSSSSENPAELSKKAVHSVKVDSRLNLYNWKKRLTVAEVDQVRQIVGEVANHYYMEDTW